MVAERHFRARGEVRWVVGVSAAPVVYFRYFGATGSSSAGSEPTR